jgi:hypothetical protein
LKDLGISSPFYISQSKVVARSLNGAEKRKLFSQINLTELYTDIEVPNIYSINLIWNTFFNIYVSIKDNCYDSVDQIKIDCDRWLKLFLQNYQKKEVYKEVFA